MKILALILNDGAYTMLFADGERRLVCTVSETGCQSHFACEEEAAMLIGSEMNTLGYTDLSPAIELLRGYAGKHETFAATLEAILKV